MSLFISCDWGTTSFRLRLIDSGKNAAGHSILAQLSNTTGIANIFNSWRNSALPESQRITFYRSFLFDQVLLLQQQTATTVKGLPLIISGMASSTMGIIELPYRSLPIPADGTGLDSVTLPPDDHFPHQITLISGLMTGGSTLSGALTSPGTGSSTDVLRGEETLLVGAMPDPSEPERIYVFPGTHSKHIRVQHGIATGFSTFMTGEFFALLSQHSILASSVSAPQTQTLTAAFDKGLEDALGQSILHTAFQVRTNVLFSRFSKEDNYQYLSGLLIGSELQELPAQTPVTLVSSGSLLESYTRALQHTGRRDVKTLDADLAMVNAHSLLPGI